jgi:hypothetical protein
LSALLLVNSVQSRWVPKPGLTWSYSIAHKDDVILSRTEEVITIDFQKKKELIDKLHNKGKKVVCYFSGGTIEKHRDDIDDYYAVKGLIKDKNAFTEWDELWLDYRMPEIKPLIRNRMKIAIDKNCDALEVDCLGAYNHKIVTERWDDPLTKEDAYNFAITLSEMAHDLGISIGLKNVADLAPSLVDKFDFAVVESCSMSRNVCAKYESFPKKGKAVFTIHYGDYGSFDEQRSTMIREMKSFGYTCTFNNNDNLEEPGFNFNCDTGSKSSTKGSIPAMDSSAREIEPKRSTTTKKKTTTKKTTTTKKSSTTKKSTTTKKSSTTKKPTTTKKSTTTRKSSTRKTTTSRRVTIKTITTRRRTTKKTSSTKRKSSTKKTTKKTTTKKTTTKKSSTKKSSTKKTRRTVTSTKTTVTTVNNKRKTIILKIVKIYKN